MQQTPASKALGSSTRHSTARGSGNALLKDHRCGTSRRATATNPVPETRHLFAILAEVSREAVLHIAQDGTILYGNALAADWFDIAPDRIAGANIHDICRRVGCGDFWKTILGDTCATDTPHCGQTSITTKNRTRILDIHTSGVADGSSPADAVIASIRDTTEHYSRERQLREAHQRLLYHLNNSPLAVIEWDSSGSCLCWNDEAEHLFGWTHREASEKFSDCLALVHPDDLHRFVKIHDSLRAGRETSTFIQSRTVSNSGSISWCDWYLSSLLDDAGKSRGILCLVNDVTERELSERKLQTLAAALEKKVELRSILLDAANKQLEREHLVRRQLEHDMIGISEREHRRIGHDLHDGVCQELAGIRFAIAAMAASQETASHLRKRLLRIEDGILKAMHETRLLARGLAPMELENGDLAASLHELAHNTSRLHDVSCRIRWRGPKLDFPPETATHLFRIAQEALHNAIHHGTASTIDIHIAVNPRSIRLTVDDNGNGLPSTPGTPEEGRGMGQKIMRHRAGILGGSLSLSQRPNAHGTRVVCSIPSPKTVTPCQHKKRPRSKSRSSKTTH